MTTRDELDGAIGAWLGETAGAGYPDYAAEVMSLVDRSSQDRRPAWLRAPWRPDPAEAPVGHVALVIAIVSLLVLGLFTTLLLAGGRPKPPPFTLQAIVPVAGSHGAAFLSADAAGVWVTGDGTALHVDALTHAVTSVPVPRLRGTLTGIVVGGGSLWAADYDAGRVLRLDPVTGALQAEVEVLAPGALAWRDGLWVLSGGGRGLVRIGAATNTVDLRLADATAYALTPGALWVAEAATGKASAVERDPVTGAERRRVAIPYGAAGAIAVDDRGDVYVWRSGSVRSQLAVVGGATGQVSDTFVLRHDLIGGIVRVGGSMWGLVGPVADGRSRMIELGPQGATGREQDLAPGLDPDNPVVAFGSVWIPFDGRAALYLYPADALAPMR